MATTGDGPSGPISILIGTVVFTVNHAATDGVDVIGGELNPGFDGSFQNDFSPLSVTCHARKSGAWCCCAAGVAGAGDGEHCGDGECKWEGRHCWK